MKINLCVGPMSMNTINSINQFSKRYKKYITIVCSRNQIESEKLGGGYVNNFTTENFSKYIKKLDNKYLLIGRDHGGPKHQDKKSKNFQIEIANSKKSLECDIKSGFKQIHIDTVFAKKRKFDLAIELYNFCQQKSKKFKNRVSYEIGVNFHGDQFNKDEFSKIGKYFYDLKDIKFITGTTGSKIKNSKQVGRFNRTNSKLISEKLKKHKILIKDHNCDFLNNKQISMRKHCGISSFNIGPELAYVENNILYKYGVNSKNIYYTKFFKKVLETQKWKKWCDHKCSKKIKFNSTAHYYYNDINYQHFIENEIDKKKFNKEVLNAHIQVYKKFY